MILSVGMWCEAGGQECKNWMHLKQCYPYSSFSWEEQRQERRELELLIFLIHCIPCEGFLYC